MEKDSIVVLNLQNPREKIFGRLLEISVSGMTIKGIDVNSFNDWLNQFSTPENMPICATTSFYPMHRIISCYLDEDAGSVPSFSTRFLNRIEKEIKEVL